MEIYPSKLFYTVFTDCLQLSLTRESINRSTKVGICNSHGGLSIDEWYSTDALSRYTGIIVIPTQDSSLVKLSVPLILYICYTYFFWSKITIPLFDNVFRNKDDSMFEALITATLTSRIELWNNKTFHPNKTEFNLEEFLGVKSLKSNDSFKEAYYKTVNREIQDSCFLFLK